MPKIKSERSWLQSTTPSSLLLALKGKRMPRQRRLIAVACCRRYLEQMEDPQSRQCVEVAERFADGAATAEELERAFLSAQTIAQDQLERCQRLPALEQYACWRAWRLTYAAQFCGARTGMEEAAILLLKRASGLGQEHEHRERIEQCDLIRDMLGNPFRPLPSIDPAWLSWGDGVVGRLAQTIHDERRFTDLPVLGDALEEAGCADEGLLGHCRGGTLHARGCWAIDLLSGKR